MIMSMFCSTNRTVVPISALSVMKCSRDLLDDRGLDAFGWLVEQQQIGVADQRAADRQLLLLAAAHGAGALALRVGEDREIAVDQLVELACRS